jgi:hypothetical protein
MRRRQQQPFERCVLDQASGIEHEHALAEAGHQRQIMANKE